MDFSKLAQQDILDATQKALEANGFNVLIVENAEDAKAKALGLVPEGAEVFNMTSVTLDTIGVAKELNESGKYNSVRNKLNDPAILPREKKRLGAAPEYVMGSVNAVTVGGVLLNGSNSGSQLPAYIYGADHVIFVVGTQKIVKDVEEGKQRIYEYVLPKESVRARAQYHLPETWDSFVSRLLISNREPAKDRTTIILMKEAAGF